MDTSISLTVDPLLLLTRPEQIMQSLSLQVLKKRIELVQKMNGIEYKHGNMTGRVVDVKNSSITVVMTDGTKKELSLTPQRCRQLVAATIR